MYQSFTDEIFASDHTAFTLDSIEQLILAEIAATIDDVYTEITSPTYGLQQIEIEVDDILSLVGGGDEAVNLTTGPVKKSRFTYNIQNMVLNNTTSDANVVVQIFDISSSPKTLIFADTLIVPVNGSSEVGYDISVRAYEVQFLNVLPGITCWTSGIDYSGEDVESNTFWHDRLVPFI